MSYPDKCNSRERQMSNQIPKKIPIKPIWVAGAATLLALAVYPAVIDPIVNFEKWSDRQNELRGETYRKMVQAHPERMSKPKSVWEKAEEERKKAKAESD